MASLHEEADIGRSNVNIHRERNFINVYKKYEWILNNKTETYKKKIKSLIEVWLTIGEYDLENVDIQYVVQIIDWAKLHTLNIVLTGEWKIYKEHYQSKLLSQVKSTQNKLKEINNAFFTRCQKLVDVINNPWSDPILEYLVQTSDANIGPKEIEFFCVETAYLTSVRLKKLCESHCEDLALNLVKAFMKCYRLSQNETFNLNATETQIWFIFDIYVALLFKFKENDSLLELLKGLSLDEGLHLINRFSKKRVKISKVWKNCHKIAILASQVYISSAVIRPFDEIEEILASLLEAYVSLNTSEAFLKDLIESIRSIIRLADTAAHIYVFCNVFKEQFRLNMKAFTIELYIRALTTDMNHLERQKNDNEKEKAEATTTQLANGFCSLAEVLQDNIDVSRECALTAFSLRPTLERLRQIEEYARLSGINVLDTGQEWKCSLHPPALPSDDLVWQCTACGDWMCKPQVNISMNTNIALNEAVTAEKLGVTHELCDDLVVLLSSPRYQIFSWLLDWANLHRLCIMYLHDPERTKNFVTELKFLDIDYSMFVDIKKEPIDDYAGIEKGYEKYLDHNFMSEDYHPSTSNSEDYDFQTSLAHNGHYVPQTKSNPDTLKSLRMYRKNIRRSVLDSHEVNVPEKVFKSNDSLKFENSSSLNREVSHCSDVEPRNYSNSYIDSSECLPSSVNVGLFQTDYAIPQGLTSPTDYSIPRDFDVFNSKYGEHTTDMASKNVQIAILPHCGGQVAVNKVHNKLEATWQDYTLGETNTKAINMQCTLSEIHQTNSEIDNYFPCDKEESIAINYSLSKPPSQKRTHNCKKPEKNLCKNRTYSRKEKKNSRLEDKNSDVNCDKKVKRQPKNPPTSSKSCKDDSDSRDSSYLMEESQDRKRSGESDKLTTNLEAEEFPGNISAKACEIKTANASIRDNLFKRKEPTTAKKAYGRRGRLSEDVLRLLDEEMAKFKAENDFKLCKENNADINIVEAPKKVQKESNFNPNGHIQMNSILNDNNSAMRNPRAILQPIPPISAYAKALERNLSGLNDTSLIRPHNVDQIVNVVQIVDGRTSASTQSNHNSTQVTPHIQRIGQPRLEKGQSSEMQPNTSLHSSPSSCSSSGSTSTVTSIKTTTAQSSLINILSQQIIKPAQATRSRTKSPVLNIISHQVIKPATPNNLKRTSASSQTAEIQVKQTKVQSTRTFQQLIPVDGNLKNMTTIKNKVSTQSTGQSTILQFICKSALPKFQQAFGKNIAQTTTEVTAVDSTNIETSVITNGEERRCSKFTSQNAQQIQGKVIYARQVPIGMIPQGRGQLFRISATNTEQISVVKESVIHGKMSTLLAAALQKKPGNTHTNIEIRSETSTKKMTITKPSLIDNTHNVQPEVIQLPSSVIQSSPPPEPNLSSTTLEQLREFDMVYRQVKERSSTSTQSESSPETEVESLEPPSPRIVAYLNQEQKTTQLTPVIVVSNYCNLQGGTPVLSVATHGTATSCISSSTLTLQKVSIKSSKSKVIKNTTIHTTKTAIPKPPPKPQEDEHTTQRIFDILAEYAEQLRNSPDLNNKPAPRRRSNPPTGSSHGKRKKSGSSSKKIDNDSSDMEGDDQRTMGSEDSSCSMAPSSGRDDDPMNSVSDSSTSGQSLAISDSKTAIAPNVVAGESEISKALKLPSTAVLMPGNYIMPVSMVKGGQQIAVVTGGNKILATVPSKPGSNMLLFQSILNQKRKGNIPTVKYSSLQSVTGIPSQNIEGITASPPVIVPIKAHSLATVSLGKSVTIKKMEDLEASNTEFLLRIAKPKEGLNLTSNAASSAQPDSTTGINNIGSLKLREVDFKSSSTSKYFHSFKKTTINTPIATSVIAQAASVRQSVLQDTLQADQNLRVVDGSSEGNIGRIQIVQQNFQYLQKQSWQAN